MDDDKKKSDPFNLTSNLPDLDSLKEDSVPDPLSTPEPQYPDLSSLSSSSPNPTEPSNPPTSEPQPNAPQPQPPQPTSPSPPIPEPVLPPEPSSVPPSPPSPTPSPQPEPTQPIPEPPASPPSEPYQPEIPYQPAPQDQTLTDGPQPQNPPAGGGEPQLPQEPQTQVAYEQPQGQTEVLQPSLEKKGLSKLLIVLLIILFLTIASSVVMVLTGKIKAPFLTKEEEATTQSSTQTEAPTLPQSPKRESSGFSTEEQTQNSEEQTFKRIEGEYKNEKLGISFKPPLGWEEVNSSVGGLVTIRAPEPDETVEGRKFNTSIAIQVDQPVEDFDAYIAENTAIFPLLNDFKKISDERKTVAGEPTYSIDFTFKYGSSDLRQKHNLVHKNAQALDMIFTSSPSFWDKYSPLFEAALGSLKFIGRRV